MFLFDYQRNVISKANVFFMVFFCLFLSCNSQEDISENEKIAIKNILRLYGGELKYEVGNDKIDKEKTYLQLSLLNADTIEDYSEFPNLPASNIALSLYLANSQTKTNKFTNYRVILEFEDDSKIYEYSYKTLKEVSTLLLSANEMAKFLSCGNYSSAIGNLEENPNFPINKKKLIKGLRRVDEEYGIVKNYQIVGFSENNLDTGMSFFKIYGIFRKEVQDNIFALFINSQSKKVFFLEYKWR